MEHNTLSFCRVTCRTNKLTELVYCIRQRRAVAAACAGPGGRTRGAHRNGAEEPRAEPAAPSPFPLSVSLCSRRSSLGRQGTALPGHRGAQPRGSSPEPRNASGVLPSQGLSCVYGCSWCLLSPAPLPVHCEHGCQCRPRHCDSVGAAVPPACCSDAQFAQLRWLVFGEHLPCTHGWGGRGADGSRVVSTSCFGDRLCPSAPDVRCSSRCRNAGRGKAPGGLAGLCGLR